METLRELRKRIRLARRQVSATDRELWSQRIGAKFEAMKSFQAADRVAGFLAFDGEADPLRLMIAACESGKSVYVPTIVAKGQPLMFKAWSTDAEMEPNQFGILEPKVPRSEWLGPRDLDFVITPLVGFNEYCHRIGVGGGFYDRTFAFLNAPREPELPAGMKDRHPQLVGFAFGIQRVDSIAAAPWDVPLDAVVTEDDVFVRDA
ncbi:MAG: 5-formyltetrahydrofolate cyclo-ligase [Mariniblastus sp.]